MISGLYAAATGMMAIETSQDVIANNIANASTAGFRRQIALQKGFDQVMLNRLSSPPRLNAERAPGGGLKLVETFTDSGGGAITTTGDPLNIALSGPGFLVVDTPQGQRFTRNGDLTVDVDGQLATADGFKLQSAGGGAIAVSGGSAQVDENGTVLVDGTAQGQLRIVEFEDPHMLARVGHNYFSASDQALQRSGPAEKTRVAPDSLETSNVQLPYEMIQMTIALRAYAANQKTINAIDDTVGRLINDVGTPI